MARSSRAEPSAPLIRLDVRAALRVVAGFCAALVIWLTFSAPYERALASVAQVLVNAMERPAVTTLAASGGEILVDRSDFPPSSPRPGIPNSLSLAMSEPREMLRT